jgi:hypothetical protein
MVFFLIVFCLLRRSVCRGWYLGYVCSDGRAIAQAVSRWLLTAAARGGFSLGFVVDKVALGQVFPEYFGFPCQSSFHQSLHFQNHTGQIQEARSGRRAEWIQFGFHPHYEK